MFISYKYKNYLAKKDGKYTLEYEITDSEFRTVLGVVDTEGVATYATDAAIAVIREYSKRNLNVAANLAIAFVWCNKKYPVWSIQQMIDYNKYNPLFKQYKEDLQKYLVLL
jgi:hypothetical protein